MKTSTCWKETETTWQSSVRRIGYTVCTFTFLLVSQSILMLSCMGSFNAQKFQQASIPHLSAAYHLGWRNTSTKQYLRASWEPEAWIRALMILNGWSWMMTSPVFASVWRDQWIPFGLTLDFDQNFGAHMLRSPSGWIQLLKLTPFCAVETVGKHSCPMWFIFLQWWYSHWYCCTFQIRYLAGI